MAGSFSKSIREVLPGSYWNFTVEPVITVPVSPGATVAISEPHDWGPEDTATFLASPAQFDAIFGDSPTTARRLVYDAFIGEGLPGKGGASGVWFVRTSSSSAAKATITLKNTANADAVTFTARYTGDRAEGLIFQTQAGASGRTQLVIRDGASPLETFDYPSALISELVADVNASSGFFTAALKADNVALNAVASAQPTGGDNGGTLLGADVTQGLSALEQQDFGVYASAATDPTIRALLTAYVKDQRSLGKRMTLVHGGALDESYATGKADALALGDEDILRFGVGHIEDTTYVTGDDPPEVISTAQGVGRVAGAVARRGESYDMVNVRFAGWRVVNGASRAQAKDAATSGLSVLTQDRHPDAPTHIPVAPTTYTAGPSDKSPKPNRIYGVVKFMRTMHGIQQELSTSQEIEPGFIDGRGVTPRNVDLILGDARDRMQRRQDLGILQPGWSVEQDTDPPPTRRDNFVQVKYGVEFVPGLRAIYNSVRVS